MCPLSHGTCPQGGPLFPSLCPLHHPRWSLVTCTSTAPVVVRSGPTDVCLGCLPQGAGLQGHSHSLSTFLGPHAAPCISVLSCVTWDQTAWLIVHIEQRRCPFPPHVPLKGFRAVWPLDFSAVTDRRCQPKGAEPPRPSLGWPCVSLGSRRRVSGCRCIKCHFTSSLPPFFSPWERGQQALVSFYT